MTQAMTGSTFAMHLKDYGVVIPNNTVKITLKAIGADDPVYFIFHITKLGETLQKEEKGYIVNTQGYNITSRELYAYLKDLLPLPAETCEFEISAEANDIVYISILAELPESSFDFLKEGYTFNKPSSTLKGDKVKEILMQFKKH